MPDLGEIAAVVVGMGVMAVLRSMRMTMGMSRSTRVAVQLRPVGVVMRVMRVVMLVLAVRVGVGVIMRQMDVKLRADDAAAGLTADVQVVAGDAETGERAFEFGRVDAQVEERADKHVAADAAEQIEVERFHEDSPARALIWLAA